MRKEWKRYGLASTLGILLTIGSATAAENTHQAKPLAMEFHKAFGATMADPGNPDKAIYYSHTAEMMGDYESAIPPLERLLMFNPNLPNIHLKLGTLYHKLGSNDIAKAHFEAAIKSKNVSARVQSKAKQYLKGL